MSTLHLHSQGWAFELVTMVEARRMKRSRLRAKVSMLMLMLHGCCRRENWWIYLGIQGGPGFLSMARPGQQVFEDSKAAKKKGSENRAWRRFLLFVLLPMIRTLVTKKPQSNQTEAPEIIKKHTHANFSQFWWFKIRRTTFLNYIKLADLLILRLF